VSDSGSETGAASLAHVRPDAVSLTAHSVLTSAYIPHQVCYSNVCAVRDEEAAGSNPATPTQVTGHLPRWDVAFLMPYSSKVQQRLRAKLPPEPRECLERPLVGDLGVDIHRHVDLRMAQDPHGHPRMHVERRQESGTGMPLMGNSP
jgi:hypothetical protein